MADEGARVVKRKRIKLPDGGTVDVPVIAQITFLDVPERGQETEYTIDNTAQADRDVHYAAIDESGTTLENVDASGNGPPDADGNPTSSSGLIVERIDLWRVSDAPDRGQESFIAPDSKTVAQPPDAPPYFTTHYKTHIVRYINTPDDGNSVDSELIDEIRVGDAPDRGQESFIVLNNPPANQDIDGITIGTPVDGTNDGTEAPIYTIQVDPQLPDISDSGNGVDPPWRLDPFQNIVQVTGGDLLITFRQVYGATPARADGVHGTAYGFNGKEFTKLADVPVPDNVTITTPITGFFVSEYSGGTNYGIGAISSDQSTWQEGQHVSTVLNYASTTDFAIDVQKAALGQGGPIQDFVIYAEGDAGAVLQVNSNDISKYLSSNAALGYGHGVWLSTGIEIKVSDNQYLGYTRTRIYKSTDGAQTWQQTYLGDGDPTGIGHVRVKSDDPDIPDNSVYVGCNSKTIENNILDPPTYKLLISSDGDGAIWGVSSRSGFNIDNVNTVNGALFATGFIIIRSKDGVSWDDVTPSGYAPIDYEPLGGVAYGSRLNQDDGPENAKPRYVTVTNLFRSFISDDGMSWQEGGSLPAPEGGNRFIGTVSGIAASSDVIVAAYTPDQNTGCIARSDDGGLHWSLVNLPSGGGSDYTVVRGVRYSHGKFVAAGESGFNPQQSGCIWTSKDGTNWTLEVQIENGGFQIVCVGMALGQVKKPAALNDAG